MLWFLQKQKYISHLFLFAFSIILAHSIIPHDHHTDLYGSTCSTKCNTVPAKQGDSKRLPWHCEAFNHVMLFEHNSLHKYNVTSLLQISFAEFHIGGMFCLPDFEPQESTQNSIPLSHNPLISQISLRAPPLFI
jgi:hypothetical protein